MAVQKRSIKDVAVARAATSRDAFLDLAGYLENLSEEAWDGPTGCAEWTMHDLAGHVVGEAVWFPNLVRGVTKDEPALLSETWEELGQLPGPAIAARMASAADELVAAVEEATPEQLEQLVDFGSSRVPLGEALSFSVLESVIHNWDARARRESSAVIPSPWARELAGVLPPFVPMLAHADQVSEGTGRYLIEVGDTVGPITVIADEDGVQTRAGQAGTPDVTMQCTADQYVRLLTGRLALAPELDSGRVPITGDRARAEELNRIFAGLGQ